jgi:hypothetical protein
MKTVVYHGTHDVRVHDVPDPEIVDAGDAIIEVTATAICGSDFHLYDGFMPTMEEGDVLGHEPMGEVVDVGSDVKKIEERRPSRCTFPDLVRHLLLLREGPVLAVRHIRDGLAHSGHGLVQGGSQSVPRHEPVSDPAGPLKPQTNHDAVRPRGRAR